MSASFEVDIHLKVVGSTPEYIFAPNIPAYVPFESTLHALVERHKEAKIELRNIVTTLFCYCRFFNNDIQTLQSLEDFIESCPSTLSELQQAISTEFARLANAELDYFKTKEAAYQSLGKRIKNTPFSDKLYRSAMQYVIRPAQHWNNKKKEFVDYSTQWRGAYKSYDLKKERAHTTSINVAQDAARLSTLIDLFSKESFCTSDSASLEMFNDHMCLAILANRPKSVFSIKNSSLKREHNDPRAIVIKGAWAPQWEFWINDEFECEVSYAVPRRFVRCCLKKWQAATSTEDKEKWQNKVIAVLEQEHHVSNHVPYRELRETLRTSPERINRISELLQLHPKARIYEATHDSDLVGLRVKTDGATDSLALGLYSYYERILTKYFVEHGRNLPEVATTGYRAVYEPARYLQKGGNVDDAKTYYAWVYQAIEDDRYARAAASEVDFRASYIAEPNALFLVPFGAAKMPYCFLGFGKDVALMGKINTYDPKESMLVLSQIYASKGDHTKEEFTLDFFSGSATTSEPRILFDPKHPVWMKVPDRMLQYKKSKTDFDTQKIGSFNYDTDKFVVKDVEKAQEFAANISQTPFATIDYAKTLYAQFGLIGKTCYFPDPLFCYDMINMIAIYQSNVLFTKLICCLFSYYEQPIGWKKLELNAEEQKSNSEVFEGLENIRNGAQLAKFISTIYGANVGEILGSIAKKIAAARQAHHNAFFLEDAPDRSSRTSVKAAIDHSPIGAAID